MVTTALQLLTAAGFELAYSHLEIWFRREGIESAELQCALAREVLATTEAALERLSRPEQRRMHS
jgi:hypothetical protein